MTDPGDTRFLAAVGRLPLLDGERERRLARRARAGDVVARDALVQANLRLVVHLARGVPRAGTLLSLADLVQEGAVGLATAAERFDPSAGPRFGTFARVYVLDALQDAVARSRRGVRLSVHAHRRLRSLQHAEARLTAELRRAPRTGELATELGLEPDDVRELQRVAAGPVSLDASSDDGAPLAELLAAETDDTADDDAPLDAEGLRDALLSLPRAEREVLGLRFGLDGHEPRTCAEVGRLLHAGSRRVAAVERRALRRLRAGAAT